MKLLKARMLMDKLEGIVNIPDDFRGEEVEIIIRRVNEPSLADQLKGCILHTDQTRDDLRDERLGIIST